MPVQPTLPLAPPLQLTNDELGEVARRRWEQQQMVNADLYRRNHVHANLSRRYPIGVGRLLRKLKGTKYTRYTTDSLTTTLQALADETPPRALHIKGKGWIKR